MSGDQDLRAKKMDGSRMEGLGSERRVHVLGEVSRGWRQGQRGKTTERQGSHYSS